MAISLVRFSAKNDTMLTTPINDKTNERTEKIKAIRAIRHSEAYILLYSCVSNFTQKINRKQQAAAMDNPMILTAE
jgi:hypothetical protein